MAAAKKHIPIVKKRMSTPTRQVLNIGPRTIRSTMQNIAEDDIKGRNVSTATRVIDSNALTQAGGSRRVSITEFEDDSRVKLQCHRYVAILLH